MGSLPAPQGKLDRRIWLGACGALRVTGSRNHRSAPLMPLARRLNPSTICSLHHHPPAPTRKLSHNQNAHIPYPMTLWQPATTTPGLMVPSLPNAVVARQESKEAWLILVVGGLSSARNWLRRYPRVQPLSYRNITL